VNFARTYLMLGKNGLELPGLEAFTVRLVSLVAHDRLRRISMSRRSTFFARVLLNSSSVPTP